MSLDFSQCKNHRQRRALLRRHRRRQKRQDAARERIAVEEAAEAARLQDPHYRAVVAARLRRDEAEAAEAEEESRRAREAFLAYDKTVVAAWEQKKARERQEAARREEQERFIREEWMREEAAALAKKEHQATLLREAFAAEKTPVSQNGATTVLSEEAGAQSPWHNPFAPAGSETSQARCSFFLKTGSCRFGDRCSRQHPTCSGSRCLLFKNFFSNLHFDGALRHEADQDVALEFDERDMQEAYNEFYADVRPEFQKFGRVVVIRTALNSGHHLRGNVYVEFESETEAAAALAGISGRWFAGKRLSGTFVEIPSWKEAICGLFFTDRCPRGKNCNFLHIFRNPDESHRQWNQRLPSARASHSSSARHSSSRSCHRRRRSPSTPPSSSPSRSPSPSPPRERRRRRRQENVERRHRRRRRSRSRS